jgi:hypothetical protein
LCCGRDARAARFRIATKNPYLGTQSLKLCHRILLCGSRRFAYVHVESVFPRPSRDWPGFDPRQVQVSFCEHSERFIQASSLIRHRKTHRQLGRIGQDFRLACYHQEARKVGLVVFDPLTKDHSAVPVRGKPGSYGRFRTEPSFDQCPHASRRVIGDYLTDIRVGSKETSALGERHGMRRHANRQRDVVSFIRHDQTVPDSYEHLGHSLEVRITEPVQIACYGAEKRVLDRYDSAIHVAGLDHPE